MKKILALTTVNNTVALKEAIEKIRREYGEIVKLRKVYLDEFENPDIPMELIEKEIDSSDIILVDIRGDIRLGRELPPMIKGKEKTVVVLVASGQHIFALTKMGKFRGDLIFKPEREKEFDINAYTRARKFSQLAKKLGRMIPFGTLKGMRDWVLSQEYYSEGDAENLKNLILFLLKNYTDLKDIGKIPPPKIQPPYGLYLPKGDIFYDLQEYKRKIQYVEKKPTVGALLYFGMHFYDTKPVADALYEYLKDDVNFIFIISKPHHNIEAMNRYLENADLFLNLQYFRIHGGPYGGDPAPTYRFFQKMDVPNIIGIRAYETEIKKWKEDNRGINPLETVLGVTLPELDGGIEPIFLAGLESFSDPTLGRIKQVAVVQDRVKKMGDRIRNWTLLRRKSNSQKRIAVVTYNYPPGEDNLASAGYLDVFESLKIFLGKLKERGYNVLFDSSNTRLQDLFLTSGMVNNPSYVEKCELRVPIEKYVLWFRSLPESVQEEVERHWGIPPGNIMVDKNSILIPGLILGNVFLGIQPSRGVHEDGDKVYHDKGLPPHHQYLAYYFYLEKEFHADAVLHFGMHGTLEFTKGKEIALSSECYPDILIGNMPHLYYYWIGNTSESTIAKRRSYSLCISHASPPFRSSGLYEKYIVLEDMLNQYDEEKDVKTLETIKKTAEELHLSEDPLELRKELYKIKRRLIPFGLHIMDRKPSKEELIDYLVGVLRIERNFPSILNILAKKKGLDWDNIKDARKALEIEKEAKEVIENILCNKPLKWLPEGYTRLVNDIIDKTQQISESESLLRALDGRYILPARGGDPIRDPDVYPSGRAMYAFDPRLIPTIAAEMRGKKSTDLLIESYYENHGRYPGSVGIILWGFETMKTGGDTISMILSLLGVRIKHSKNPWFKELEVVPLKELKRPRIDVVITICGIFRDTFGAHIDLIDRAIRMVAGLDEPPEKNYIREHLLQTEDKLKDYAVARIFGPSPTEYATSMRTLVESSSWRDEKDLVRSYDDSMNYTYFKGRVEKKEEAFSTILKTVDLITQERDNTEYEVTDLDHYYEFLGGLSRSVNDKKGEKADVLVIDSTEGEIEVDALKATIERATRTRILNPCWIEGMLKHDFHGSTKIKDRVECLLGFAATTRDVENWVFEEVADRLVFDEETRNKLQSNNPYATMKISELLIESERRGYWNTKQEKLRKLREIIVNMEGEVE